MSPAGRRVTLFEDQLEDWAELGLDAVEVLLLAVLRLHGQPDGTGARPSVDTLGRIARCSRPKVVKAIRHLEVLGLVTVNGGSKESGSKRGRPNTYTLNQATGFPATRQPGCHLPGNGPGNGPGKTPGNGVATIIDPDQVIKRSGGSGAETLPASASPSGQDRQAEVRQIADEHAKLWCLPEPQGLEGDDQARAVQALEAHGLETAQRAIRRHHARADRDSSQLGKDLRHVFPELRIDGKRQSNRLDHSRFLALAGPAPRPRPPAPPPEPRDPPATPEQIAAVTAKIKSEMKARAQLEEDRQQHPDRYYSDGRKRMPGV